MWQLDASMADVLSPLAAFLDSTKTSSAAFAARLQVDQTAVMRWRKGERVPTLEMALLIERKSGGAVPTSAWAKLIAAINARKAKRGIGKPSRRLPRKAVSAAMY